MILNDTKWWKNIQELKKWYEMVMKWYKIIPNDIKWDRITIKWYKIAIKWN